MHPQFGSGLGDELPGRARDGADVHLSVLVALLETSTALKSTFHSTRHPIFPYGSKAFRSLRKSSVQDASSSCCSPRRSYPPANLSIFQRSEGLAQVAMKRRYASAELSQAPSARYRHLFFLLICSHPRGKFSLYPRISLPLLFGGNGYSNAGVHLPTPFPIREEKVSRL